MKALAAFVMRGRMSAAIVAATTAVLALLVTPLAIVSAATVGLVTMRQGAREAALVGGIGLVALAVLGLLLFGQAGPLVSVGIGLWVPLILLGMALRLWRSLALTVEIAVAGGFGLVLVQYLLFDDPAVFWASLIREFFGQMLESGAVADAQVEAFIAAVAPWMVAGIAAAWVLQLTAAVFLARAWQATLYNPGGFRAEFRELRLGRWLAVLVPVLLLTGMWSGKAGLAAQLSLIGMAGFLIQGLALVHALTARLKGGFAWLVGFYLLLFVGFPYSFTAVSATGFADSWLDFRARIRPRDNAGGE